MLLLTTMVEWEPVGDLNGFKIKDVFSPSCWTVATGWSVLPGVRQGFTGEHHLRILLHLDHPDPNPCAA